MLLIVIASALRNEVECTAIPVTEALRPKLLRPVPMSGIVVGAVEVK